MEIHHAKVEKKNLKEYLLEGLMIFIAVSLGFFAENLRETIKDNSEITTDMQSLVADLRSDVEFLDSALSSNEYSYRMCDTLIQLLATDRSNTARIYFLARSATANMSYCYSNSKTFEQMKSSGTLKLIEPRSLLDSIGDYYVRFQWFSNQTELLRMKVNDIHEINPQLFDSYVFMQMLSENYNSPGKSIVVHLTPPKGHPDLLTDDPKQINAVMMSYQYFYSTMGFYNRSAQQEKQTAERLIRMIHEAYPDAGS